MQQHVFRMFGALFGGLILLGCILYILLVVHPSIERDARQHFSRSAHQLERSLLLLFQPAQNFISTAAEWVAKTTHTKELDASLNRLFIPYLRNSPSITSVVAGTPEGRGYMLLQQPDGTWLNRFTDIAEYGNRQHFVLHAPDGTPINTYTEDIDYDHSQRPWFQAAMRTTDPEELCWTRPYQFFTTKDMGITLSTRAEREDGSSIVLGFDLMLRDISKFTSAYRIGTDGFMLVMTDNLRLIGHPPAEMFSRADTPVSGLKTLESLNSEVVDTAMELWDEDVRPQDALYRFSAAGQDWFCKISMFQLGNNHFWITMFAPRHEFAPRWFLVGSYMLGAMLMMLGLVLLATRRMAHKIAAPIASVADNSEAIARLDFSIPQIAHSNILEIERLVCSHTQMSSLIQESLATVEAQKKELTHKVDELQDTRERLRENKVQLQQNLNYIQAFFDSPLIGIALVRQRTFTDCNRTFCALTGYAPSEVKGMPTRNLYASEEDYVRLEQESSPVLQQGNIYTTELALRSRSGTVTMTRVSGCLFDHNAPDKGSMWIAIPISTSSEADAE